jgi:hypothetical protein
MKKTKNEIEKPTHKWQVKDRLYELIGDRIPPVYMMKSRGLYWFDEEAGYEREIKYCRNQQTVFVDEMKGPQRLGHIVFRNGNLFVEKEQSILQQFLSLYHPDAGTVYKEFDADVEAESDIDILELQLEAMNLVKSLDVDHMEAILRS